MSKVKFTVVIYLLFTINSFSQVKVTALEEDINLNSSVDFFVEENDAPLSHKEAEEYFLNGKFSKSSSDKPINFGTGSNPVWLKVSFDPESDVSKVLHLRCPYIQKLKLYIIENKNITLTNSGKYAGFESRGGLKPKDFAWTLDFKKDIPKDVYLRINTKTALITPLSLVSFNSYIQYRSNTY